MRNRKPDVTRQQIWSCSPLLVLGLLICTLPTAAAGGGGSLGYVPGDVSSQSAIDNLVEIARQTAQRRPNATPEELATAERDYRQGKWYYADSTPAEAGAPHTCSGMFSKDGRVLVVLGGVEPDSVAALILADLQPNRSSIGRSEALEPVTLSLDQTGAARTTVQAFTHNLGDAGAIVFVLPSLQAGVDGLLDTARIQLRVGDMKIFDISYHDGLQAQARMRSCMAGA